MTISGVEFEGPYDIESTVIPANRAAVYVIVCITDEGKNVIDVGESGEVGIRISNHERKPCWEDNCTGNLYVYLHYMSSSEGYTSEDRRKLESKIRNEYNPLCGKK